jgi:hypothetical protein
MGLSMRAALYWAPAIDDPLAAAGNSWLGRDAETGAIVAQPDIPDIASVTEDARVYGFHATLRPPMRLATGWEEFCAASEEIAARTAPFALPPLEVVAVGGFLALVLTAPCPALHDLADACVAGTDRHRLPPDEHELARRRATGLSAGEAAMLARWGYPYVMDTWSFHMTLSRRLTDVEMARLLPAARAHFAEALAVARRVTEICVFTQRQNTSTDRAALLLALRLRLLGEWRATGNRAGQDVG